MEKNFKALLRNVKAIILDMDGVLTDGTLLLIPGSDPVRNMNIKDGYAMQLAIKKGYLLAVISGGKSAEAADRLKKLGITEIKMAVNDKMEALSEIMHLYDLKEEQIMYMGDDLPDMEVMMKIGVPVCPSDAAFEVKQISKYVSPIKGGKGCVRDVIQQVLMVNKHWE